jgi:hypothetical protein
MNEGPHAGPCSGFHALFDVEAVTYNRLAN